MDRPSDPAIAEARAALLAVDPDLHAVGAAHASHLARQGTRVYNRFDRDILACWADLLARDDGSFGLAALAAMVEGIAAFRRAPPEHPRPLAEDFARWHARILAAAAAARSDLYRAPNEQFFKDLAVCQGTGWPAEAWLIVRAGFSRRYLVAGGPAQWARALAFQLAGARSSQAWLTAHLNDREAACFNENGYTAMLRKASLLVARDRGLRGLFLGASWLEDPALGGVSPHLAYRSAIPLAGGARSFFVAREGRESYALSRSETRRKLYDEGRYRPERHLLIWPRKALLSWAAGVDARDGDALSGPGQA